VLRVTAGRGVTRTTEYGSSVRFNYKTYLYIILVVRGAICGGLKKKIIKTAKLDVFSRHCCRRRLHGRLLGWVVRDENGVRKNSCSWTTIYICVHTNTMYKYDFHLTRATAICRTRIVCQTRRNNNSSVPFL